MLVFVFEWIYKWIKYWFMDSWILRWINVGGEINRQMTGKADVWINIWMKKRDQLISNLCVDHDKSHDLNLVHWFYIHFGGYLEYWINYRNMNMNEFGSQLKRFLNTVSLICVQKLWLHTNHLSYIIKCAKYHNTNLGKMRADCINFLCSEYVLLISLLSL